MIRFIFLSHKYYTSSPHEVSSTDEEHFGYSSKGAICPGTTFIKNCVQNFKLEYKFSKRPTNNKASSKIHEIIMYLFLYRFKNFLQDRVVPVLLHVQILPKATTNCSNEFYTVSEHKVILLRIISH